MSRHLLTGNAAAAWGARLARADYLPAFPITPQTEIIETMSRWIAGRDIDCSMVMMDSEHSMITAAGAAAATGVRVFTATSSQGLLHAMEMLYTVAGWRVPLVIVNVSRALAAPISLEPDHNDILAARDSGCLQFHCADCQEVLDAVLMAYRITEASNVRLPAIINLDGFYLSFTREQVILPDIAEADAYLPAFRHDVGEFRGGEPSSRAVAVLGGTPYSYFRYETHLANMSALAEFSKAAAEFEDIFGRRHNAVECTQNDDAAISFVMIGSFSTKAKQAVNQLRAAGHRVGLVRPFLLRPFPETEIRTALAGKSAVIVVDQNLAPGRGGILHGEISAALAGTANAPPAILSFIGGLGGRDIAAEEFYQMAAEAEAVTAGGDLPPPRMLFTEDELKSMRKLQAVAQAEASEKDAS